MDKSSLVITFTASAWDFISKSKMVCPQAIQNRTLRLAEAYSWYAGIDKMHSDVDIPRLSLIPT